MSKHTGYAVRIRSEGYGFIKPIDGSREIFFHASSLIDTSFDELKEGDGLDFDIEQGPKSPVAASIERNSAASFNLNFLSSDDLASARLLDDTVEIFTPNLPQEARIAQTFDQKMIQFFKENPQALREIDPGLLEELYAEIMKQDGYAVELLGSCNSADGGVDLIGVRMIGEIPFRTLVQCKRWKNRVSADPVRALNGVLDRFSAHAGIVATTSFFTKPAIEETRKNYYKITLQDYESIKKQLMCLGSD